MREQPWTCECGRKLKLTRPSHSHQEERAVSCPACGKTHKQFVGSPLELSQDERNDDRHDS